MKKKTKKHRNCKFQQLLNTYGSNFITPSPGWVLKNFFQKWLVCGDSTQRWCLVVKVCVSPDGGTGSFFQLTSYFNSNAAREQILQWDIEVTLAKWTNAISQALLCTLISTPSRWLTQWSRWLTRVVCYWLAALLNIETGFHDVDRLNTEDSVE